MPNLKISQLDLAGALTGDELTIITQSGVSKQAPLSTFLAFFESEIVDGVKGDITVSGGGTIWTINDGVVTSAKLASNAVTGPKIADGAITTSKMVDAVITTAKLGGDSVTTAKMANNSVTNAKLADMAEGTFKVRRTAGTGDPEDATSAEATEMLSVFGPSGTGHAKGLVPTPGAVEGNTKFLCEDQTWKVPAGGGSGAYDIAVFISGTVLTSELVFRMKTVRGFSLPVDLAESHGTSVTSSTGTAVFSLQKNGVQFGTLTFAGSATGVFSAASGESFVEGDVLTIIGDSTADGTLADISINLKGSVS